MCSSFVCDFSLLHCKYILNSTEFKCLQNIKLYHFVRTILSIPLCPIPFCPYTILSIPFCPYHFVPYHFVRSPTEVVTTVTLPQRFLTCGSRPPRGRLRIFKGSPGTPMNL